jgi:hypothetical protein
MSNALPYDFRDLLQGKTFHSCFITSQDQSWIYGPSVMWYMTIVITLNFVLKTCYLVSLICYINPRRSIEWKISWDIFKIFTSGRPSNFRCLLSSMKLVNHSFRSSICFLLKAYKLEDEKDVTGTNRFLNTSSVRTTKIMFLKIPASFCGICLLQTFYFIKYS